MGFFDRFKGNSEPGGREGSERQQAFTLRDAIKVYGLRKQKPYEPSYGGDWWEGSSGVTRIALHEHGKRFFVHIGTVGETPDIYLGRASEEESLPPPDSPSHIGRIVNDHAAAGQYMLLAWPPGDFDHPRLRNRGVADCLVRFSPAVAEVMIYEGVYDRGVTLLIQGRQTQEEFDRDLQCGIELLKLL